LTPSNPGQRTTRCVYVGYDAIGEACLKEGSRLGIISAGLITFPWTKAMDLSGATRLQDYAAEHDLPIYETQDVNSAECMSWLTEQEPDVVLITGWPQLVRQNFLRIPKVGVFGLHPTLLPKHRGRAPIPWAILNGLTKTGVTLYQIPDASADAGPIVGQVTIRIDPRETATTLYAKVLNAHVTVLRENLHALSEGKAVLVTQDETRASSWPVRKPSDGIIDWDTSAHCVDTWIRAQTRPYPGAFTWLGGQRIIIWCASPDSRQWDAPSGQVVEESVDGVVIACGHGSLVIEELGPGAGDVRRGSDIARVIPVGTSLG
jgi:methionyl-tRNA formyltransferase